MKCGTSTEHRNFHSIFHRILRFECWKITQNYASYLLCKNPEWWSDLSKGVCIRIRVEVHCVCCICFTQHHSLFKSSYKSYWVIVIEIFNLRPNRGQCNSVKDQKKPTREEGTCQSSCPPAYLVSPISQLVTSTLVPSPTQDSSLRFFIWISGPHIPSSCSALPTILVT